MIWQQASRFLDAARILREKKDTVFSPTYFLAGQAIELALKGFHRGNGESENYLRQTLVHNLAKALSTAENNGLGSIVTISQKDRAVVQALNQHYQSKDLQYAKQGFKSRPAIDDVLSVAEKLVNGVRGYCQQNRERHYGKPTAVP